MSASGATHDDRLIARYIEPNPHKPGLDEAWLTDYAVSVWALIGYLKAVDGDIEQVAHDYRLPREAVEAAIGYYSRHSSVIDNRIAANDVDVD